MKNGGQISWNAVAICEMSKTSWQTGKLHMKEDSENHSKDRSFHSVHWWRHQARIHQFRKNVVPLIFLGYALIAVRI